MKTEYAAVIKQERDWWIGWIEEVPGVNCQERTREDLVETLRLTLREGLALTGRRLLLPVIETLVEGYRFFGPVEPQIDKKVNPQLEHFYGNHSGFCCTTEQRC